MRRAFIGPFGLMGDRRYAVVGDDGEPMSARRAHALLGFRARCADAEAGEGVHVETPSGWDLAWDDPALAAELGAALDRPVRLARSAVGVHDAAPVHLLSLGSLGAVSAWVDGEEVDRRRFRANVIVEMTDTRPYAEGAWVGATIAVGGDDGPLLRVVSPTERCAVTTFDPDTLARDTRVLAGLARETENLFGVYALVARSGWVEIGSPIRMA
jgi:MOSC domain-containing protein